MHVALGGNCSITIDNFGKSNLVGIYFSYGAEGNLGRSSNSYWRANGISRGSNFQGCETYVFFKDWMKNFKYTNGCNSDSINSIGSKLIN